MFMEWASPFKFEFQAQKAEELQNVNECLFFVASYWIWAPSDLQTTTAQDSKKNKIHHLNCIITELHWKVWLLKNT